MAIQIEPGYGGPFHAYLRVSPEGAPSFVAGLPEKEGAREVFDLTRDYSSDGIFTGIIASNPDVLDAQLQSSALHQGKKYDPITGEIPGKIHHEIDGFYGANGRHDLATTYNRCDTTGLFLIGAEALARLDRMRGSEFITRHEGHLRLAAAYIVNNLGPDSLFWDTPPPGADHYALMATYWKDTRLTRTDGKQEPVYPVSYAHAHFINARALLSASKLLNDPELAKTAHSMFLAGIKTFIRPDGFTIYKDREDQLDLPSTDELHSLAYIPTTYTHMLPLAAIRDRAKTLETPFGYSSIPLFIGRQLVDRGHGDSVWPFEQALIHYAALKHGIEDAAHTAAAVAWYINLGEERIRVESVNGVLQPKPVGNSRQLFSVAAGVYFQNESFLRQTMWL